MPVTDLNTVYDVDSRTTAFERHERGLLVAMAGPGTGKTFSMLRRITALIAGGEDIDAICYLTFIKEISSAFLADFAEEFGERGAPPRISTLHSFACRLLRNHGFQIGYGGELFFASVAELEGDVSKTFLDDVLPLVTRAECRTVAMLRDLLGVVKKAWREASRVDGLPSPIPAILPVTLLLARNYRLVDWDQAMPLGHGLLEGANTIPNWISEIKHYLVDEYQDFNGAERAFILRLLRDATSGVIVGDDDQSIYGSRGGSPEGMRLLYDSDLRDTVSLQKCYRCKATMVQAANVFQRTMRAVPRPMASNATGGQIACYRFKSSKAELAFLKDHLVARLGAVPENPKPKDRVVCLFFSKKLLNFYFDNLFPHLSCVRKKEAVWPERVWLQLALGLVHRRGQRFAERLLLNAFRDIKPRHRQLMVQRIMERDIPPSQALSSLLGENALTGAAEQGARQFVADCEALSSRDAARVQEVVTSHLGIDGGIVAEPIEALLQALHDGALDDEISSACDIILPHTAAPVEDMRAVQFLTMHGSKGLTRKNVVLPGMEDAWLPGVATGDSLAEHRRLFLVALTRATDELVVTLPQSRGRNDPNNFDTPGRGTASAFLAQAGLRVAYHD